MNTGPVPPAALAHGERARFVEEIETVGADGDSIVCRGRVPAHSPAVDGGTAGSWTTLELAAQAAALLQAATARGDGGPVAGYLVRIRRARFERPTVPAEAALVARVEPSSSRTRCTEAVRRTAKPGVVECGRARSRTTSPGRREARAVGLPQERPMLAPSGSRESSASP